MDLLHILACDPNRIFRPVLGRARKRYFSSHSVAIYFSSLILHSRTKYSRSIYEQPATQRSNIITYCHCSLSIKLTETLWTWEKTKNQEKITHVSLRRVYHHPQVKMRWTNPYKCGFRCARDFLHVTVYARVWRQNDNLNVPIINVGRTLILGLPPKNGRPIGYITLLTPISLPKRWLSHLWGLL